MTVNFQWTLIWEQPHDEAEEVAVRSQLQSAFDTGRLTIHPRCRAMEARIFSDHDRREYHTFIECTCLLTDPEKLTPQTFDVSLATQA